MTNRGGIAGIRIFLQTAIVLIDCLDPKNDWDQIQFVPDTEEKKADIALYKDGKMKTAIEVKSSAHIFEKKQVSIWLDDLRKSAEESVKKCLYLVGDFFSPSCEKFIEENRSEIQKVPLNNLQELSTVKLIGYIAGNGPDTAVMADDLKEIEEHHLLQILTNAAAGRPVSRGDFEAVFRKSIKTTRKEKLAVPQRLTSIPFINRETDLAGREDFVKDVRKMLEEGAGTVAVTGAPGIGKTAVMREVCNEVKDEDHYAAWIVCGDSLENDLLCLRGAFGVSEEEKADEAYRRVRAGMQRLGRKLYLFLDNLSRNVTETERDEIYGLGVHVMITSRSEDLPFPKKKLEYLDEDSAVKMFAGYYGGEIREEETVRKIIRYADRHTLLVELLAKAAKKERGTLEELNTKLEEGLFYELVKEIVSERDGGRQRFEETVTALYNLSGRSEEQQRIMKLFTIFTPEKEIYCEVENWAGFDREVLGELINDSWLLRGGLEMGYRIRQIVKEPIVWQLERRGERVRLEDYGSLLKDVIDTDKYLGREVPYEIVRERIVLAEDIAGFLVKEGRQDTDAGSLFNNLAGVYYERGDYGKALEYYGKALSIREKLPDTDQQDTAATYDNIADVFIAQGESDKGMEFFKKSLAIREQLFGTDHPDTAEKFYNMAKAFFIQEEHMKALIYYEQALRIRIKKLGADHPDTVETYNSMVRVFFKPDKYEKALDYYGKALEIIERLLGRDHPPIIRIYDNIAMIFHEQNDYEKALVYYKKALEISKPLPETDNPDTAAIYSDMAETYRKQGEYKIALEDCRRALGAQERVLGMDHPDTAKTYGIMGMVFRDMRDYRKAQEYLKKAYSVYVSKLGEDHPSTESMKCRIMETAILFFSGPD